jgi:hypothetical protein
VSAGLDTRRHKTEAADDQTGAELQDHQRAGRDHGQQRCAQLTPGLGIAVAPAVHALARQTFYPA